MSGTAPVLERLRGRFPLTVAAFSRMERGAEALAAVEALSEGWVELCSGGAAHGALNYAPTAADLPNCPPENTYDVIIAGGGLGLIAGAALAGRGLRVLVFDKDRVGAAHREWNISERELGALVTHGIFDWTGLEDAMAARYERGLISFEAEGTGVPACPLETRGVLDVALDAQAVLDLARRRFLEAGGTILEHRAFQRLHIAERGRVRSVFEVKGPHGREFYGARLAIDTMGSVSPVARALNRGLPFDGVCPTAGTIVRGLEGDPTTGDVLVSIGPSAEGRQLIWEGFPGSRGETTVYLFYYDRAGARFAETQSLLELFERYFKLLPTYRTPGPGFEHLRPVFGYIPSRYGRSGSTAARGLICLGDSAAGQSPLTFCGFGSFVRHVGRITALLHYALRRDLLEEAHLRAIGPHQANLQVAWVFSRFMQPWSGGGQWGVNRLMNVFCRALHDLGPSTTMRFLQDRYTFREYLRIMLTTARHYPAVFGLTARVLGPVGLLRWLGDIAAFATNDAARAVSGRGQAYWWRTIERRALRAAPRAFLRLRALSSTWYANR